MVHAELAKTAPCISSERNRFPTRFGYIMLNFYLNLAALGGGIWQDGAGKRAHQQSLALSFFFFFPFLIPPLLNVLSKRKGKLFEARLESRKK